MAQQAKETLRRRRILVVEDSFLVAEAIRAILEDGGCRVVGPVGRLPEAIALARDQELDAAVLDINLNGDRCFPVAETLSARRIPFLFLTGYDDSGLIPPALRPARRLGKPIVAQDLLDSLRELVAPP